MLHLCCLSQHCGAHSTVHDLFNSRGLPNHPEITLGVDTSGIAPE
ncbi:hypothetical protein NOCARDAX2BIS_220147 [Nocardioides sp. AX2bis]|nr:hypothetical protein NOCARDAX2BIS_220147 [Nocardioides sp. AX2bis]